MTVIGITGGFGTGKTTITKQFKRLGAIVFDADEIAHDALTPKTPTYKKILSIFGKGILKKDEEIDRRRLGKIVFRNKASLKRLCGVVHPYVIKRIKRDIKGIKKRSPHAVIVLDIPLLIEANLKYLVDELIVVITNKKVQISRCRRKAGLNEKEILARIRAQMPLREKIRISDFIIDNSGTKGQTKREVRKIWLEIQKQKIR